MSKAFTEADFYFQLNQDFNWRLKEISSLKAAIGHCGVSEKSVLLRSLITMLYAHWEGHVKFCANKYFEHLTIKKLPFNRLSRQIYKNHFLARISAMAQSRPNLSQRCELIDAILDSTEQRFSRINPDLVDTGSNLSSDILQNICKICSIDFSCFLEDRDFIDRIILKRRNSIAHGEETYIELSELDDVCQKVIDIMRKFRDELQNIVALRSFEHSVA